MFGPSLGIALQGGSWVTVCLPLPTVRECAKVRYRRLSDSRRQSSPDRWQTSGSLVMAAAVVVLPFPYAVSAYHLEVGGRALKQSLGMTDLLEWWYIGPREVPQALQKAVTHLQRVDA